MAEPRPAALLCTPCLSFSRIERRRSDYFYRIALPARRRPRLLQGQVAARPTTTLTTFTQKGSKSFHENDRFTRYPGATTSFTGSGISALSMSSPCRGAARVLCEGEAPSAPLIP
ncbi:hypothetical protein E2C01_042596 [Portunus trituberculatus]|uniref:Uncharacterized protein n=1 Tax=Portunus trituberculatus TaxID=210409 RepID=A0A5B7FV39_PORTR|nr:hypothetical protein [Portunus trituberculatus]